MRDSDDAIELLRALLIRAEKEHTTRPEHKPLRWRRRRETHRNYMRFEYGSRPRCLS
jgi:hypothetical protein